MSKIEKISHRYIIALKLIFLAIILGMVYFWSTYMTSYDIFSKIGFGLNDTYSNIVQAPISLKTRVIGFVVSLIPALIVLYIIGKLIKLFKNYQKGVIFSLENVNIYKKLAYSLYIWVIAKILYDALITLVLSFNNPPGHRLIMITFQSPSILAIAIGTIILMISYVMNEALELSEENKLTI